MANAEVSSTIAEIAAAVSSETAVAGEQAEISVTLGGEELISSVRLEIATIIPNGEAAAASVIAETAITLNGEMEVSSALIEIAIFFPATTNNSLLQSEFIKRQPNLQSHHVRINSGQKSNF